MPADYLHNHKHFSDLLRIIEDETGIQAGLVEKDYWIMHSLYDAYYTHKAKRFPKVDFEIPIVENQAFLLQDMELRASFKKRYALSDALYYNGQPEFDLFIDRISGYIEKL